MQLQSVEASPRATPDVSLRPALPTDAPSSPPTEASPPARLATRSAAVDTAVRGKPSVTLLLPEPRADRPSRPPVPAPNKPDDSALTDFSLLGSPALLADYVAWSRDYEAVHERGSATLAYRDLAMILYDRLIGRPWGDAYFPEVQKRLDEFRKHFCTADLPAGCSVPTEVHDDAGLQAIAKALTNPQLLKEIETRWGVHVHPAVFLNAPRSFDLLVDKREQRESATQSFWKMTPRQVEWTFTTPVIQGVDAYLAGFEGKDFAGQFAVEGDRIVVNDWLLRDRAMTFASSWKFKLKVGQNHPRTNPVYDSEDIQFKRLFDDYRDEFEKTYNALLPKVADNKDVLARFLKERAAGDYPEEVYQHVAYAHLRDLLRLESGFYALAKDQRTTTSARQVVLESLLTMQRYEPAWRFFLLELTTQAQLITSHSAVLDQMVDPLLGFTYFTEQLKAILGMEGYGNTQLYDRFRYAILADELFDADYLKEYQPAIYKELLQGDGTLKRVADLAPGDQRRILRSYLMSDDNKISTTGAVRLQAVVGARIKEEDLRFLADIIHQAKVKEG